MNSVLYYMLPIAKIEYYPNLQKYPIERYIKKFPKIKKPPIVFLGYSLLSYDDPL